MPREKKFCDLCRVAVVNMGRHCLTEKHLRMVKWNEECNKVPEEWQVSTPEPVSWFGWFFKWLSSIYPFRRWFL